MDSVYINGYNVSMDEDENEVVINFILTTPQLDHDNGDKLVAKTETVARIIMRKDMADTLADAIRNTVDKNNIED